VRIVVTVKDVPDISGARQLGADGRLVRDDGDSTLNELDENAVQAAVDLRAATGGEVVVLSIGPSQAVSAVRRALQLGADRGVLVSDETLAGLDAPATGVALAAAIAADGGADLVLCGMSATDGMTSVVPGALAAALGVPAVTLAAALEVTDGRVMVRRELADVTERVEVDLPAVVSVSDQVNEPAVPGFKAILGARKKPVERLDAAALAPGLAALGLAAADLTARTRVVDTHLRPPRTDQVLVDDDGTAGATLAAWLVDRHLV